MNLYSLNRFICSGSSSAISVSPISMSSLFRYLNPLKFCCACNRFPSLSKLLDTSTLHKGHVVFLSIHSPIQWAWNMCLSSQGSLMISLASSNLSHHIQHPSSSVISLRLSFNDAAFKSMSLTFNLFICCFLPCIIIIQMKHHTQEHKHQIIKSNKKHTNTSNKIIRRPMYKLVAWVLQSFSDFKNCEVTW